MFSKKLLGRKLLFSLNNSRLHKSQNDVVDLYFFFKFSIPTKEHKSWAQEYHYQLFDEESCDYSALYKFDKWCCLEEDVLQEWLNTHYQNEDDWKQWN